MSQGTAEKLYTPQMLAAAVELASFPPLENAPFHGSARSATCGSTLDMDISTNPDGSISQIGMKVRACAVGQAAAAVFARHAAGKSVEEIDDALRALTRWLETAEAEPDWPDIALIAAARDYPGRHGAMLLPWRAALAALPTAR